MSAKDTTYDAASIHITFAAPRRAISTPASAGPANDVTFVAPSRTLFARAIRCSSSPTIAGIEVR